MGRVCHFCILTVNSNQDHAIEVGWDAMINGIPEDPRATYRSALPVNWDTR